MPRASEKTRHFGGLEGRNYHVAHIYRMFYDGFCMRNIKRISSHTSEIDVDDVNRLILPRTLMREYH